MLHNALSSTLTDTGSSLYGMNPGIFPSTVGTRLRQARESAGLSQTALAQSIGATRSAIAQVESGISTSLNAENLAKAAALLGKNAVWLATGEGEEHSNSVFTEVISEMTEEDRQQVFDFILYKIERPTAPLLEQKTANNYAKMIEKVKAEMELLKKR